MSDDLFRSEQVSVSEAPGESSAPAKWFLLWLAIGTVGLLTVVGLGNAWVDAYGLYPSWHKKDLPRGFRYLANERYAKIQEFEAGSFDGVVLGGSRVAFLSTGSLNALTGGNFYNFGINSLGLGEAEAYVYRIAQSSKVKTMLIGLNFYCFSSKDPEWETIDPEVIEGTLPGRLTHFMSLNLSWDATGRSMDLLQKARRGAKPKFPIIADIDAAGNRIHGPQNPQTRPQGWARVTKQFLARYRNFDYDPQRLERVARMRAHLEAKGIKVTFFITPEAEDLLDQIAQYCVDDLAQWKHDLSLVTGYYDFFYSSSVTRNPENFFDPSHHTPEVGTMMFQRMFAPEKAVPDFGEWVAETTL